MIYCAALKDTFSFPLMYHFYWRYLCVNSFSVQILPIATSFVPSLHFGQRPDQGLIYVSSTVFSSVYNDLEMQHHCRRRLPLRHRRLARLLHFYIAQEVVYRVRPVTTVGVVSVIGVLYQYLNLIACRARSRVFASLDLEEL